MEPDDRAEVLSDLPEEQLVELLSAIRPEERAQTEQMLSYPAESVGRLATLYLISVRPNWSAGRALEEIRRKEREAEIVNIVYVTNSQHQLLDYLYLREIILADPSEPISSLMQGNYVTLNVADDREEAVRLMGRYDLPALPVVTDNQKLVGIITFDDVADVAEEEVTEDFHKGGAVAPDTMSYNESGIFSLFKRRVGWLLILVAVNLVASGVIARFEETLSTFVALAFFIPLLIASGGNTGSQSATLLIRALATEDVELSEWLATLLKEIGVGSALALILGIASCVMGLYRGGNEIAIIVGTSMVAIILSANLIGALLPFLLVKVKIDPAMAGSPLITSIMDSVGLMIYFSIATYILV